RHLVGLRYAMEDLVEDGGAHIVHQHLGLDAAQEGFIGQVVRIHVGGEDHHQLEGHLEFHTRCQGQVIHAAVERHYPAVEKFARRHHLAAEVVDDQDAVVGLHLKRRDETAGGFIEL